MKKAANTFSQKIFKIGINPCVVPSEAVLEPIFEQAGKRTGHIPVRGTLDGAPFTQTLVRYAGAWRLYINGPMLKSSELKNGDIAHIELEYDPSDRTIPTHPQLAKAFKKNRAARTAYERLAPHRQKEINRYLGFAKTPETLKRNADIILDHLSGKEARGLYALLRIKR